MEDQMSLLNEIKKLLGINSEDTSFDPDILVNINAAMFVLTELGVISKMVTVFKDSTFLDIFGEREDRDAIVYYLFLKAKVGFDNSTMGTVLKEIYKDMIAEAEWRLREFAENKAFHDEE